MAESTIRVSAKFQNGITEVKALLKHPMESGLRTDKTTGELIPAHFIKELKCEHNGKEVMSALWSGSISKNPYVEFRFKGGVVGDKVSVSWKDNKDETDSAEAQIK
jgi:sulfur-oxidizing protein SoxZ